MKILENNNAIAEKWINAFNVHDLKKLLLLYAEDATHYSPKLKIKQPHTNGWIKGKTALKDWWADAFNCIPSLQYKLKNIIVDDKQLLMEYMRKADNEPEMMVAEILEIQDGLIVGSRVYHG
ncbi:MAG: nuclear transport factor 2 family protein [Ferruginibacter sp.]